MIYPIKYPICWYVHDDMHWQWYFLCDKQGIREAGDVSYIYFWGS